MREVLMAAIVVGLPSLVVLTMVVLRHRERVAKLLSERAPSPPKLGGS